LGVNRQAVSDGVEALLDWSASTLAGLGSAYATTLIAGQLADPILVTLKQVLEAQRSALDYLAWSITEAYGRVDDSTYYPFAKTPEGFDARMNRDMKGVAAARADIAETIRRHQPYGRDALDHLNKLSRYVKHRHLSRHVRAERSGEVLIRPEGTVGWYGGGTPLYLVSPDAAEPEATGRVETTLVEWRFVDPDVPLLETLWDIQLVVVAAVVDIRQTVLVDR
jgi:hypothetical protein